MLEHRKKSFGSICPVNLACAFMTNFVAFRSTLYNIKKSQKLTPTVYNVPDHQLEELKCFPFREFIYITVRTKNVHVNGPL
jgi:hypothetical protein